MRIKQKKITFTFPINDSLEFFFFDSKKKIHKLLTIFLKCMSIWWVSYTTNKIDNYYINLYDGCKYI